MEINLSYCEFKYSFVIIDQSFTTRTGRFEKTLSIGDDWTIGIVPTNKDSHARWVSIPFPGGLIENL